MLVWSQENLQPLPPFLCLVPCHFPPSPSGLFIFMGCFTICWFYSFFFSLLKIICSYWTLKNQLRQNLLQEALLILFLTSHPTERKGSESEVAQAHRLFVQLCQLFAIPWTVACEAPPSMGFSRQEYWSGLPFPSPGNLPDPGIKPRSPALQTDSTIGATGESPTGSVIPLLSHKSLPLPSQCWSPSLHLPWDTKTAS